MTRAHLQDLLVLRVARMPASGETIRFALEEAVRAKIATELGLTSLAGLTGTLDANTWQKVGVRVTGEIAADVVQESVVTLEPIERRYFIDFDVIFVPETSRLARRRAADEQELFVDPEGDDPPEVFSGDEIDLLPFVVEQLALEIDPYPRDDGEAFEEVDTDPEPDAGRVSPFASLSSLKKQQRDDK